MLFTQSIMPYMHSVNNMVTDDKEDMIDCQSDNSDSDPDNTSGRNCSLYSGRVENTYRLQLANNSNECI